MIATLRSEWIKLRTVRSHLVLAIIAVLFPLIITLLTVILINERDLNDDTVVSVLVGSSLVTMLMFGVLGALSVTGEFTYNTIRPTFAATPSRTRVIVAKAIVTAAIVTVLQLLILVIGYGVGGAIVSGRNEAVDAGRFTDGRAMMVAALVAAPLFAIAGVGLGSLIRNQAAANTLLVMWPLIGEQLLYGLLSVIRLRGLGDYLPYQAGFRMMQSDSSDIALGRVGSGLVFAVFAAAALALGTFAVNRRDA